MRRSVAVCSMRSVSCTATNEIGQQASTTSATWCAFTYANCHLDFDAGTSPSFSHLFSVCSLKACKHLKGECPAERHLRRFLYYIGDANTTQSVARFNLFRLFILLRSCQACVNDAFSSNSAVYIFKKGYEQTNPVRSGEGKRHNVLDSFPAAPSLVLLRQRCWP